MATFKDSEEFWNKKYRGDAYRFGTEPADFLVAQTDHIPSASSVLCICDGEGRNSVFLAGLGHTVSAFDVAKVGIEKARILAAEKGVQVAFHHAGVEDWDWSQTFDAVVGIFFQFAGPDLRAQIFEGVARSLRPGGVFLLHGYAPRQVGYGTGGPPVPENLYTLEMLTRAFPDWEILHSADEDRDIDEGAGHSGLSALIDFVARKPA